MSPRWQADSNTRGRIYASRKPPSSLDSFNHLLRGRQHVYRWTPEDNRKAREHFERAVALDPSYAPAYAGLAKTHYISWASGWSADQGEGYKQVWAHAEKAVALDEADSRTHTVLGLANLSQRYYDRARNHLDRAISLNPSDTRALVNYARCEMITGNPARATEHLNNTARLDPYGKFDWPRGMVYYTAQRYDDAIIAFENMRDPVAVARAWIAASYAQARRQDDARRAAAGCLAAAKVEMASAGAPFPESWRAFMAARWPYQNQVDLDNLLDGLGKGVCLNGLRKAESGIWCTVLVRLASHTGHETHSSTSSSRFPLWGKERNRSRCSR